MCLRKHCANSGFPVMILVQIANSFCVEIVTHKYHGFSSQTSNIKYSLWYFTVSEPPLCLYVRLYSKVYSKAMTFKLLTGGQCKKTHFALGLGIHMHAYVSLKHKFNKIKLCLTTSTAFIFSIPLHLFLFSAIPLYFCMLVMIHYINFMNHPGFPSQSLKNISLRRILALPTSGL